ncbi:MAG: lipoyl(octanoyl) transferase LipB [Candidatus Sericytochromatia bacterium]|nr:lipoyl(octanoyl) transferase LipB [Candidatus Sericytochromatia bacterium]
MTVVPSPSLPPHNASSLEVRWLGRQPYQRVHAEQLARVDAIAGGQASEIALLVEHDPVITVGRRREALGNVLDPGDVPVVEVERGGDATYHGPGQLVGYPLLRLGPGEQDLHAHLRRLEGALIAVLAAYGLEAGRCQGQSGVWIGPRKVASVGVAVRRWVTYHGFALNVDTPLAPFHRLNPCGLPAGVMTTMAEEMGGACPGLGEVARALLEALPGALNRAGRAR